VFLRVFWGFLGVLRVPGRGGGPKGGSKLGSQVGSGKGTQGPPRGVQGPPGGSLGFLSQHSGFWGKPRFWRKPRKSCVLAKTQKVVFFVIFGFFRLKNGSENDEKKEDAVTGPCPFWAFYPFSPSWPSRDGLGPLGGPWGVLDPVPDGPKQPVRGAFRCAFSPFF